MIPISNLLAAEPFPIKFHVEPREQVQYGAEFICPVIVYVNSTDYLDDIETPGVQILLLNSQREETNFRIQGNHQNTVLSKGKPEREGCAAFFELAISIPGEYYLEAFCWFEGENLGRVLSRKFQVTKTPTIQRLVPSEINKLVRLREDMDDWYKGLVNTCLQAWERVTVEPPSF